ncbi:DUF3465 domain-containing protein [Sinobacterium caligoides]|nr:DUF3465 domain-containing protein [Sinobacterium caligoides]
MKKILYFILLALAAYFYLTDSTTFSPETSNKAALSVNDDRALSNALDNKLSNIQVRGSGTVKAILRDDNKGSRHQKFILALDSGQTILIAHNIDLSSRVAKLNKGDRVEFYGEYEWNNRGGVVHWTHHDPKGRHANGWLKHNGTTYR